VIGIIFLSHGLKQFGGTGEQDSSWRENVSLGSIVAHGVLVHNFSPRWYMGIDPPMWSVAVEWQIYFLLPLILLPLYRRLGLMLAVGACVALSLAPHFLLSSYNLDWCCPWYFGLFALAAGAVLNFSEVPSHRRMETRVRWKPLALTLGGALVVAAICWPNLITGDSGFQWLVDLLAGVATVAVIVQCARAARDGEAPGLGGRLFSSLPVVLLGEFSYSLYLVHYPVLQKLQQVLRAHHFSYGQQVAAQWAIGLPAVIGLAYVFHLMFERPFVSGFRKEADRSFTTERAGSSSIVAP
jgi:peptidoglycan/LPS O-acetylase OafA/YrhL